MAKKQQRISDLYHPESAVGTEFRRLLHNVTKPVDGVERKAFLVTSAVVGEGKSTVCSYLAITAAAYKKRKTILIDCDLRRPSLHRMFGLSLENGVTDVIAGKIEAEQAYKGTQFENLWVLTAGTAAGNPAELFERDSVKNVIDQVKFYFDLIFIDCAPIIPVSDPLTLAPELDGMLMVVKAGSTQREVIKRACLLAEQADARIIGIALNNVDGVLPYYFSHKYYGYNYSSNR